MPAGQLNKGGSVFNEAFGSVQLSEQCNKSGNAEYFDSCVRLSTGRIVLRIARRVFNTEPYILKYKSNECDVFRLRFADARLADRILKIDRQQSFVRREQQILRHLEPYLGHLPQVEHTQRDFRDERLDFTIMLRPDHYHFSALYAQDPRRMVVLFEELGNFLASLQHLSVAQEGCFRSPRQMKEYIEFNLTEMSSLLTTHAMVSSRVIRFLRVLQPFAMACRGCFGHNSPQVVLPSLNEFYFIDWTQAGASYGSYDLAHFLHRLRGWDWPDIESTYCEDALLRGFGRGNRPPAGVLHEIQIWEAFHHLRDVVWHLKRGELCRAEGRLGTALRLIEHCTL